MAVGGKLSRMQTGKKTGRPPTLSTPDIVAAALAGDLSELTMPSVAKRLGVSHSALYRYFADREALLRACSDHVVRQTVWPDTNRPWREFLKDFCDVLWSSFERYPGLAQVGLAVPGTPPAIIEIVEKLVGSLTAQGFTPHDAILAVDFISEVTMTQFAMMAAMDKTVSSADSRSARQAYQESWNASESLIEGIGDESTWHGRGWLDEKITIMLDGLEKRVIG
jgi:TetR/AcrR family tetracycline transcriptional repressor